MASKPVIRRSGNAAGVQNFIGVEDKFRAFDNNPMNDGRFLEGIDVGTRSSIKLHHGLGRKYRGMICTSHTGVSIDRTAGDKETTLTLTLAAALNNETIDIWVF